MHENENRPFISARCLCRFLIGLVCGVLVCTPSPGSSNWAPMEQKGGAALPRENGSNIRMESEQVMIRLRPRSYTVEAVFHFTNTGKTTTEWVGFPKRGIWVFGKFDAWVNDRKVEVSEEPDSEAKRGIVERVVSGLCHYILGRDDRVRPTTDRGWLVLQVAFPGRSPTIIRTTYDGHYGSGTAGHMDYIIGTGSYWKGPIRRAVFIIDSSDVGGNKNINVDLHDLGMAPGPELMGENLLRLEIMHFKPPPGSMLAIHFKR